MTEYSSGSNPLENDSIIVDAEPLGDISGRLLAAPDQPLTLLDADRESSGLPTCIDRVTLQATASNLGPAEIELFGSVDLAVEIIEPYTTAKPEWHAELLQQLADALEQSGRWVETLSHDFSAIYIRTDQEHVIAIRIISGMTSCSIELSNEHVGELESQQASVSRVPATTSSSSESLLRDTASCLRTTLATVIQLFADRDEGSVAAEPRLRLSLTLPEKNAQAHHSIEIDQRIGASAAELVHVPSGELTQEHGADTLYQLGGLHIPRKRLLEIARLYNDPLALSMYGISHPELLLHGPEGNGKTTLIEAFARQIKAEVRTISPVDYALRTNALANLEEIFSTCQSSWEPRVLVFEDIDVLCQERNGYNVYPALLERFRALVRETHQKYQHIVIFGTTQAELSELDRKIVVPGIMEPIAVSLPTEQERREILTSLMANDIEPEQQDDRSPQEALRFRVYDHTIDIVWLATATDRYSIRDLVELLQQARINAYNRYKETGAEARVNQPDMEAALARYRRQ